MQRQRLWWWSKKTMTGWALNWSRIQMVISLKHFLLDLSFLFFRFLMLSMMLWLFLSCPPRKLPHPKTWSSSLAGILGKNEKRKDASRTAMNRIGSSINERKRALKQQHRQQTGAKFGEESYSRLQFKEKRNSLSCCNILIVILHVRLVRHGMKDRSRASFSSSI